MDTNNPTQDNSRVSTEYHPRRRGNTRHRSPISIARGFDLSASPTQPNRPDMNAIRTLGVVLIELCFGRPIEGHPLRMNHAEGGDDRVVAALDLAAAVTWLSDVQGEAGSDYADAVAWCLTGCGTAATQKAWRQEMLRNVVVPLERCCQCLV